MQGMDSGSAAPPSGGARFARAIQTILAALLVGASLLWTLDVPLHAGISIFKEQLLLFGFGLGLGLIMLDVSESSSKDAVVRLWLYRTLALAGLAACLYLTFSYQRLAFTVAFRPLDALIAATVMVLIGLEGLRRTSGWGIFIIVLIFLFYGYFGHMFPGEFRARPVALDRLALYVGLDANGIIGLALNVAMTIVIPFVLFGQLLMRCGAAEFFTNIAAAAMGRYRGGPAKIAVVASALFGTISGNAVSNVVASGVVTIPLMKRAGYPGNVAGGVEAVASTGGQIMPPVMGSAAFLMAEFLEMPYREVMLAALLPALLYFLAVFIQVDLLAAARGIKGLSRGEIPSLRLTLREGWHFVLPFVVLVVALFEFNMAPERAAVFASLTLVLFTLVFGYQGKRPTLGALWQSVIATGKSVTSIIAICAAVGIVIGILSLTGLAFNLTLHLIAASGGSLIVLALLTAVVSILLGMGMPTVGVYVLLATLAAPALIQADVPPIAAHLFVMYFGMLSMVRGGEPGGGKSVADELGLGKARVECLHRAFPLYRVADLVVNRPAGGGDLGGRHGHDRRLRRDRRNRRLPARRTCAVDSDRPVRGRHRSGHARGRLRRRVLWRGRGPRPHRRSGRCTSPERPAARGFAGQAAEIGRFRLPRSSGPCHATHRAVARCDNHVRWHVSRRRLPAAEIQK
mgnify:CR=1 FL=1